MVREPDEMCQLKLRFRERTRSAIEKAAHAAGNSLNAEIVQRLERSIIEDEQNAGPLTASIMRGISSDITRVEHSTGKSWMDDLQTWAAVNYLIEARINSFQPSPINKADLEKACERYSEIRSSLNGVLAALKSRGVIKTPENAVVNALLGNRQDAPLHIRLIADRLRTDTMLAEAIPEGGFLDAAIDAVEAVFVEFPDDLRAPFSDKFGVKIHVALYLEGYETHADLTHYPPEFTGKDGAPISDPHEQTALRSLLYQAGEFKNDEIGAQFEYQVAKRPGLKDAIIGRRIGADMRGPLPDIDLPSFEERWVR